jgi:hypothetical protein
MTSLNRPYSGRRVSPNPVISNAYGPWPLFRFLNSYAQSVGLLGRRIGSSQGHCLHRTTQTQNKRTQISMPRVGFKPTIPVFERPKTVHALDRAATVIDSSSFLCPNILLNILFSYSCSLCSYRPGFPPN